MMLTRTAERRTSRRRVGFTLAEVTVATALLIVFGTLCVATLRYGAGLWRSGHRRSYAYDVAEGVFRNFDADFSEALSQFWNKDGDAFDPRIRFIVDEDDFTYPAGDADRQRIRFVRRIPDSTTNPRIRDAGDGVDNDNDGFADEEIYNLKDDDQANDVAVHGTGLIDEDLAPMEGMCEVAYMRGLTTEDRNTLYRIVLAPIGGLDSVFEGVGWPYDANIDDWDEIYDPANPNAGWAVPITENVVLHFEVRLWTQYTTSWDETVPFAPWGNSFEAEDCGPVFIWNSDGNDVDDIRDNVYPRAAMVILVVEPPERMKPIGGLRLQMSPTGSALPADATAIPVAGNAPAFNHKFPYILIRDDTNGDEWVRFETFDAANQQFILDPASDYGARGVRGTEAVDHPDGCEISFGYTVVGVFQNPRGREYWGHVED
jgi:hypothetical protein